MVAPMAVSRAISRSFAASALAAVLAPAAATLAGCETSAPRCAFTPCGGALEGMWTITERCPAPPVECPAARVDYGDSALEGTFTFTGHTTYLATIRQKGTIVSTVPLACYPNASGCDAVALELRSAAARDTPTRVAAVSCTGQSVCTCRQVLREEPVTESGTYRVTGTRVILTSGGDATTDEYCVAGRELRLRASLIGVAAGADVLLLTR
jgi:hypothetical protein